MPTRSQQRRRPGRAGVWVLVAGVVLLLVAAVTPAPYVIRQPGPAFDALSTTEVTADDGTKQEVEVVTIDGAASYPIEQGELTVMTVNIYGSPQYQPSWFEAGVAWLSPSRDVLPMEAYYPDGVSKESRDEESAALMQHSQATAIAAALQEQGYDVPSEVVVASVNEGGPSDGLLQPGDVLLKYGETPVPDYATIGKLTLTTDPLVVTFRRDGVEQTATITPKPTETPDGEKPLLGIVVTEQFNFPVEVDIELGDVGGPSAGLVFALATIDKLTPGNLVGDHTVAASGTMSAEGNVGPIGGIRQKLYAADEIDADYFIAAEANCAEALSGDVPGNMPVYAVATLDEAMQVVTANAAGDPAGLRTCTDALAANVPQR